VSEAKTGEVARADRSAVEPRELEGSK